jgi:DNA-binding NarL/FixJ family response regulator
MRSAEMDEHVADRFHRLSEQQRRMVRLAAGGAPAAEIAARLSIPMHRIPREWLAVLAILGVRDEREAAVLWWGSRAGARLDLAHAARQLIA